MNRNCNARSKQKRKKLRFKNFWIRIFHNRELRKLNSLKPKSFPFRGKAINIAIDYHKLFPSNNGGFLFDHNHGKTLNQRQKRKRALQV